MKSYRQIFKYDSKLGYKYVKNLSLTILGDSVEGSKDYKLVTDSFKDYDIDYIRYSI